MGGSILFSLDSLGVLGAAFAGEAPKRSLQMIVVDYRKCTGCRTCEAVCSAYAERRMISGTMVPGTSNPHRSAIRVHSFNPDVDIPVVCAMCADAPCIAACPIVADPATGRKALYRDPKGQAIRCDAERCVGCGSCVNICRTGIISLSPESRRPHRMCTLCDGSPQCVRQCPYGALSLAKVDVRRELYGKRAEVIANELIRRYYGPARQEG